MDIFDYSPHLLKMQALIKELTSSTLYKDWDTSRELSLQIATEAKLLLNWLNEQSIGKKLSFQDNFPKLPTGRYICHVCNRQEMVRAKFDEESG